MRLVLPGMAPRAEEVADTVCPGFQRDGVRGKSPPAETADVDRVVDEFGNLIVGRTGSGSR